MYIIFFVLVICFCLLNMLLLSRRENNLILNIMFSFKDWKYWLIIYGLNILQLSDIFSHLTTSAYLRIYCIVKFLPTFYTWFLPSFCFLTFTINTIFTFAAIRIINTAFIGIKIWNLSSLNNDDGRCDCYYYSCQCNNWYVEFFQKFSFFKYNSSESILWNPSIFHFKCCNPGFRPRFLAIYVMKSLMGQLKSLSTLLRKNIAVNLSLPNIRPNSLIAKKGISAEIMTSAFASIS